jgi:hypothetical protein
MIVTMRVFDPSHPDVGLVRQNWLRTEKARKALAEKNGGREPGFIRACMRSPR